MSSPSLTSSLPLPFTRFASSLPLPFFPSCLLPLPFPFFPPCLPLYIPLYTPTDFNNKNEKSSKIFFICLFRSLRRGKQLYQPYAHVRVPFTGMYFLYEMYQHILCYLYQYINMLFTYINCHLTNSINYIDYIYYTGFPIKDARLLKYY